MIAKNEHRILWLPTEERMWDDDGGSRSSAGVRIDSNNAHTVAAVFSCLRVIAETVASLPLHVLERTPGGGKRIARELPLYRQLHSQPNGWQTSFEWREQACFHIGLWGDAFSELRAGQIVPLHPSRMKVERIENGKIRYKFREDKGTETIYSNEQILQIRGPSDDGINGMSIVEECKDAIALARACELHGARFFAAGARPGFVLSTDGNLNAEARESLRSQWDRRHGGVGNSHNTAVLTGGLRPYEIPQSSNSDAQFLELRRYQLEEIARLFRCPGWLLGVGSSSPQSEMEFVTHTILPWLRRFESAFMRDLIEDDDRYLIEFDVRGLMRGDPSSRASFMRSLWEIGALNTDEIRELENMDPVEGGSVRYRPLNMGTLGAPPSEADVLAQQQPGSGIDGQAVEGGLAAAAGEAVPAVPGEPSQPEAPQVADVSLNGAQITGLIQIISQVPVGLLTKEGAAAMIAASFPSISPAQIQGILAGVSGTLPQQTDGPAKPPVVRSAVESRTMTVSIDFDRTFAADPALWGEFAKKAVADGNTVVMISRRPEEDRATVMETLGDYAEAFSQVLLVGGDTLKGDAAAAAGIEVDVWVDDSPQTIRAAEQRAEPGTVTEGDFVSWGSSGGRARGRVDHVMDYGTLDIPGTDFKIEASKEDPAALITVYEEVAGGWRATETQVGHKVSTLTKIDALPEPDEKRDCGANATGGGGFQPGNSCGKGGGGTGGAGSSGGASSGTSGGKSGGTKAQKTRQTNKTKKQAQSDIESLDKQKSDIGAAIESDRWRGDSHGQAESINKLKERVPDESKAYDDAVSAAGDAELQANVAKFKFEKDPTGVTEKVIKTPLSEEQWKQTPAYKKWQKSINEAAKAEKKLKAAMLKKLDEVHAKQVARVEKELQDKLSEIDGA